MKKLQNIYLYFKLRSIKDILLDFFKFIIRTWIYIIIFLSSFCILMNYIGYDSDIVYLQKDNKKIVLIGTIHISNNADYYNNISKLNNIYKDQNYKLYYETLKYNENASDYTKQNMMDLEETFLIFTKAGKLKQQHDYLNYSEEDKNADIDILQLEKMNGIKEIKKITSYNHLIKSNNLNTKQNEKTFLNYYFEEGLKYYVRSSLISGLYINRFSDINKKRFDIILKERNKALINSIDYNENAVINYGDSHLSGIIQLLEKKGYTVVAEHKLKAF